jgi:hypothetical protein
LKVLVAQMDADSKMASKPVQVKGKIVDDFAAKVAAQMNRNK